MKCSVPLTFKAWAREMRDKPTAGHIGAAQHCHFEDYCKQFLCNGLASAMIGSRNIKTPKNITTVKTSLPAAACCLYSGLRLKEQPRQLATGKRKSPDFSQPPSGSKKPGVCDAGFCHTCLKESNLKHLKLCHWVPLRSLTSMGFGGNSFSNFSC